MAIGVAIAFRLGAHPLVIFSCAAVGACGYMVGTSLSDVESLVTAGPAGAFLAVLIYTLFFALPFEETYVAQDAHKTYDKKMYALCRHPGVLWFAGFYICLWLAFGTKPLLVMAIWFSLLNFCYIVLQDDYTFPRIFSDYEDYKKRVPFLLPNGKSLKRCIDTFKESR